MAGHNKWSKIKHKKAKTDAQKGKAFSMVVREIVMAVKLGGEDPDMNSRLRLALQKAKEVNMPNDNIKRAIQKGAGNSNDANYEEVTFEAYGPNGVGLIIETLTDNRNRTVPNIKAILTRANGSLATKGAVAFNFKKMGVFVFEPGTSEDNIMDVVLDAGAEDIDSQDDGSIDVMCPSESFFDVMKALDSASIAYASAELSMIPNTTVPLSEEDALKIETLIEKLEEDDDVQEVYSNLETVL